MFMMQICVQVFNKLIADWCVASPEEEKVCNHLKILLLPIVAYNFHLCSLCSAAISFVVFDMIRSNFLVAGCSNCFILSAHLTMFGTFR